jgi:hypothetical protein
MNKWESLLERAQAIKMPLFSGTGLLVKQTSFPAAL